MNKFRTLLIFLIAGKVGAQTSVYECQGNAAVTPAIINNSGSVFQQNCIDFPNNQTFTYSGTFNKEIQATKEIRIEPGLTAGSFTDGGGIKFSVTPASSFDVMVMNYPDLTNVLKLEKLELGIKLPTDVQTKVTNFIANTPNAVKLNPFLEWQLRVVAEFSQNNNQNLYQVDGFYFRNFRRNETTDYWDDMGTDYPFRIRFAPKNTGKWKCTIKIYVNNSLSYTCTPFAFNVADSNNPGFVTKHTNGKNLVRGDDSHFIYPVGTNLPFPGGGESGMIDYGGGPGYLAGFKMHYLKDFLNNIQAYIDAGGKYIRYIVSQPSSEIEFEKLGNYYDRLMFATEIDNLLDLAHNNDVLIHFNLMLHTAIMQSGDYYHYGWDFGTNGGVFPNSAYCYSSAFNTQLPSDMVLNTTNLVDGHTAMEYLKQRYRYYFARYGYSTNITLFELLSEPWHMNERLDHNSNNNTSHYAPAIKGHDSEGDVARKAIRQFHSQLADYIKNHLNHTDHLIAVLGMLPAQSLYGIEHYDVNGNYLPFSHPNAIQEDSWSDPNIDLATFSHYDANPNVMIHKKPGSEGPLGHFSFDQNEISIAYTVWKIKSTFGKLALIAEGGVGDISSGCSSNKMHEFYARRFGFTGLAGFNMWEGWTYPDPTTPYGDNHVVFWPHVINVQNHMNGNDARSVVGTNWAQGRQVQKGNDEDDTRENQYYISSDKERGIGYIANRTYNPYTLKTDTNSYCNSIQVGANYDVFLNLQSCYGNTLFCRRLGIEGLKPNTDYQIDWYHYGNGAYFFSDCFNTDGNGIWVMNHPVLDMQSPLLYYVIKQHNCQTRAALAQADSTDIEKHVATDNSWQLFPNPAEETLFIKGPEPIQSYTLLDQSGKVIEHIQINNLRELELPLSHLQKGIYFIELNQGAGKLHFVKI